MPTSASIPDHIRVTSPATGEVAEDDRVDAYLGDGSTMQKLREQADAVVERVRPQIESAQEFARADPMKAILISAAAGAALMAVVGLVVRSSSHPSPMRRIERSASRSASYLVAVREAAVNLADRAQSAAQSALSTSQTAWSRGKDVVERGREQVERGREALDSGRAAWNAERKHAAETASDTQDALADTWSSIRDQAQPLIDKLRPQLDAAVTYARQDPARTALGLAAAGAVIVGLLSLLGDDD